ncbi:MAG: acetate--CoA ligase [Acidimicrobiales bacterium]
MHLSQHEEIPPPAAPPVPPVVEDYDKACASFSWSHERAALDGLAGGGLNIAHEAVVRHARRDPDRVALRFVPREGPTTEVSFGRLDEASNRFANVLTGLDVAPGERVFAVLGRTPLVHVSALGALKRRAVFCPLFSAFGPEPIRQRLTIGAAAVVVTTPQLYERRIAPIRDQLPGVVHVLVAGCGAAGPPEGALDLDALLAAASPRYEIEPTDAEDLAILHFTSGTTGLPKGAMHVHDAVVGHAASAAIALDLRPGDVFWCTADPGWVTGTSYGVIAPLVLGVTSVVDEGDFDAERWWRILQQERVSVWYTAPTAVRMLMRAGAEAARAFDTSALRFVASVGEPLSADAVRWGVEAFGLPIHDNWWQTETGGIMIANLAAAPIRPGSMGRPLPGVEAAILAVDADNEVVGAAQGAPRPLTEPGAVGMLALRAGWPSMFRGYLGEEERYRRCFVGDWYSTGDLASCDADGWFWFVGRADDVIKTAGHLIGPFEVESALREHPAVADAAAFGKPDPVAGAVIKAVVVLKAGLAGDDALRRDVLRLARQRLGPAVAPREIAFADALPKTRSGKVMRRLLRARELGLPEGDTSALETGA